MMTRAIALLTMLAAAALCAPVSAAARRTVHAWETIEFDPPIPIRSTNPFDPDKEAVTAVVTNGADSYTVSGFAWRGYTRALEGGYEKLAPDGEPRWKIRFTPPSAGEWQVVITSTPGGAPSDNAAPITETFTALPPAPGGRGFVRVSAEDPRYFRFDDGSPYFPVGENLAWYDGRGTFAYDDWLDKLAASGANYVRLWMPAWAFSLETVSRGAGGEKKSSLGNYADRMSAAWQLDYVIAQLEKRGIRAMLCIQNHGPFSYKVNSEWETNAYNAANGGPLEKAGDFYTDPEAKKLFKRRLAYIVSRWGHSPAVMSWELWNEVNFTEYRSADDVAEWHQEMAAELKRLDPHKRPVTTSIGGSTQKETELAEKLWPLPGIDFTQIHIYASPPLINYDFDTEFTRIAAGLSKHGKPVLPAEAGVDGRGPAETLAADPDFLGMREIIWGGIFSGAAGAGMPWWWDNLIAPKDRYDLFASAAKFTAGVAFHLESFKLTAPDAEAPGVALKARALEGKSTTLVWVRDAKSKWHNKKRKPRTVAGAQLRIQPPGQGAARAEIISTQTGETLKTIELPASETPASIPLPDFQDDIAVKIISKNK